MILWTFFGILDQCAVAWWSAKLSQNASFLVRGGKNRFDMLITNCYKSLHSLTLFSSCLKRWKSCKNCRSFKQLLSAFWPTTKSSKLSWWWEDFFVYFYWQMKSSRSAFVFFRRFSFWLITAALQVPVHHKAAREQMQKLWKSFFVLSHYYVIKMGIRAFPMNEKRGSSHTAKVMRKSYWICKGRNLFLCLPFCLKSHFIQFKVTQHSIKAWKVKTFQRSCVQGGHR